MVPGIDSLRKEIGSLGTPTVAYVDFTNLVSVGRGYDWDDEGETDGAGWWPDYGALASALGCPSGYARIYGSCKSEQKRLQMVKTIERFGMLPTIFLRNHAREKQVDTSIAVALSRAVWTGAASEGSIVVLVTGDIDLLPAVLAAQKDGLKVVLATWEAGSAELKQAADHVVVLDPYREALAFQRASYGYLR